MTPFGTLPSGEAVHAIDLAAGDLRARILTYGAILQSLRFRDIPHSLTRGAEDLDTYLTEKPYHGVIIGPVANRISNARVRLDGMMYELTRNQDGRINLHSGGRGTQARVWEVEDCSDAHVTLRCEMQDGDCDLPGRRLFRATYRIEAPATLALDLTCEVDAKTLVNMAHHGFWNLDGTDGWAGHRLRIAADRYLPTDDDHCPTGEVAPVDGTPFDLRRGATPTPGTPPLDHNFCLSDAPVPLRDVLWLTGTGGVEMTLATDQPGVQVYDGRPGHHALAIEPQHWPDAPNHRGFPSIVAGPGAPYRQQTRWRFAAP